MKIYVVGLGPGDEMFMTPQAKQAIAESDVIVGYTVYVDLIKHLTVGKETVTTSMKQEVDRCVITLERALEGKTVSMVCSGDAGVYGMAGVIIEICKNNPEVEIEIVPGITAACSAAAVLGAPLMHDFAIISLSDLLTPWEKIEKRLELASAADFVISIYNPSSIKRHDYLNKACNIMMKHKSGDTPCGYVKFIGREGQEHEICTLRELADTQLNMFSTIVVGNSETVIINNRIVTPRGYKNI